MPSICASPSAANCSTVLTVFMRRTSRGDLTRMLVVRAGLTTAAELEEMVQLMIFDKISSLERFGSETKIETEDRQWARDQVYSSILSGV
ncbi:hypothetical protein RRG08_009135 [Elysia crispata]|uniref:Uncharacterized protein n=1 Tax=Elysia crispata TaxID=231223 RepID=A0AAE0YNX2_9GAST|nr:hypothetical protein RRG08_009135 [Elysia crispata]